jgi:predicted nucleotidyltransferase
MSIASNRDIATPAEIRPLVDAIRQRLKPDSIWLFGSRARGDATIASDWDICVALPDDADPALHDPLVGWELQHAFQVPATIVTTSTTELEESWGAVNTLGYELARDARRIAD